MVVSDAAKRGGAVAIPNHATTVMGDLDGDGVADFWIVLTGVHALDAADFLL